ncbi:MAG: AAA family ATPase [Bacteroidales bacterium]|nr:AAA family ATPase [Bacteroidales bacterium]
MNYTNFENLVEKINHDLGAEFCNQFQIKRRDLAMKERLASRDKLFGNVKDGWAINKGGGIEVQYHIGYDATDSIIVYGLGFNTQYVPFANEMSMVGYMRPFINAFLQMEARIREILPDYEFVYGSADELRNPQEGQYYLYGKSIEVGEDAMGFIIEDAHYNVMIEDFKRQFAVYVEIYDNKNKLFKTIYNMDSITKLLHEKGQIILQGAPGTGKTYTAKDIAEFIIFNAVSEDKAIQNRNLEKCDQFKIIQFHAAYSYEDFVRGITATTIGSSISYNTINKTFAEFAETANTNFINSKKNHDELSVDTWIDREFEKFSQGVEREISETGRLQLTDKVYIFQVDDDCFRYKGDIWSYDGRANFKELKKLIKVNIGKPLKDMEFPDSISTHVRYRKSYYLPIINLFYNRAEPYHALAVEAEELKDYILIVDEINRANLPSVLGELIYALEYRGEKVSSMYTLDDGTSSIVIPPNLLIIGTMNTADRSVGHIDYAIRRRFAFVDMLPTPRPVKEFALPYFKIVSSLFIRNYDAIGNWDQPKIERSEHLASDIRPEDVWIGHSYFIAADEGKFKLKLQYEVVPILKEYLKDGVLLDSAKSIINELS